MKFIFCLLSIFFLKRSQQGHIISQEIGITYNYEGYAQKFDLFFQLQSGLSPEEYFRIDWPYTLGSNSNVKCSLYLFSTNLRVAYNVPADANSLLTYFFFNLKANVLANTWYRMEIMIVSPPQTPPGLQSNPVSVQTVSSSGNNYLIYDINLSFGTIYLAPISSKFTPVSIFFPEESLAIINNPGAQYFMYIDLVLQVPQRDGSLIQVQIIQGSDGQSFDFNFVGICRSVEDSLSGILPTSSTCEISPELNSLTLNFLNGYIQGEKIMIQVRVNNPNYVSSRSVRVYVTSKFDGRTIEKQEIDSILRVTPISISPGSRQFLWGLGKERASQVYKQLPNGVLGPLNSIKIGFQVSKPVPIGTSYEVYIYIGATGIQEGSVMSNLPQVQNKQIICSYKTSTLQIKCINVGALSELPTFEYFVAFKAFFDYTIDEEIANFGGVEIVSKVWNNGNLVQGVYIFESMTQEVIKVVENSEYLDTAGWHNTSVFGLGTTQVISMYDDNTISGAAVAATQFFSKPSSVGIFQNNVEKQQLLFFLKVQVAQYSATPSVNTYTKMSILFNPKVISTQSLWIDYAAYNSSGKTHTTDAFQCFSKQQCSWHNVSQQANKVTNFPSILKESAYSSIDFECGVLSSTGNDPTINCNNFQGLGTTDSSGGIISLRNVKFPESYSGTIYPDEMLLDFVVSFSEAKVEAGVIGTYKITSQQLINAYMLRNSHLSNLKASFVNFYGSSSLSNDGGRIPTMLRIGGSVKSEEFKGANRILLFFDSAIDSSSFYNERENTENYEVGCSQASCYYYPSNGVASTGDSWSTSRMVLIKNLPKIQNEFNILIPVTNQPNTFPLFLTIAFALDDGVAPGPLKILNSYRIFGQVIEESVQLPVRSINGLTFNIQQNLNFENNFKENILDQFNYAIDLSKISHQGTDTTLIKSLGSQLTYNAGSGKFGAGITITGLQTQSARFFSASENNPDCVRFHYTFNDLSNSKSVIFTIFCPLDFQQDLSSSNLDIQLTRPSYSKYMVPNYPLDLAYSLSTNDGKLVAYKKDNQVIPLTSKLYTCVTTQIFSIHSNSIGNQRVVFDIVVPQAIDLDPTGRFPTIQIKIILGTNFGITFARDCSVPNLACSMVNNGATVTYTLTSTYAISQNQFLITQNVNSQGQVFSSQSVSYTIEVLIPVSQNYAIFSRCTLGQFRLDGSPIGSKMKVEELKFDVLEKNARGVFRFNFKSVSIREVFFKSAQLEFDFGFLADPNFLNPDNVALTVSNKFRCLVMESGRISWKWKQIIFSNRKIILKSKNDISYLSNYTFTIECIGGATPDDTDTSNGITARWVDNTQEIQAVIDPIAYPLTIITSPRQFRTPPVLQKLFSSPGFDAFYTFKIVSDTPLDYDSRIYIEFSYGLSPQINRGGYFECYIRLGDNITHSVCEVISERKIQIWFSYQTPAQEVFYVDIYGVSLPKTSDFILSDGGATIWIGLDQDSNPQNGLTSHTSIQDLNPTLIELAPLTISNVQLTTNYINQLHNIHITITLPSGTVKGGKALFIDFPKSFAVQNERGKRVICGVMLSDGSSTMDYATSCIFLSSLRLKLLFATDSSNLLIERTYNISLYDLWSPPQAISAEMNLKFIVFLASLNTDSLTHIGVDYQTFRTVYRADKSKKDLIWSEEGTGLTQSEIYIGYYRKHTILQQTPYSLFSTSFDFIFINDQKFMFNLNLFQIKIFQSSLPILVAAKQDTPAGVYILHVEKTTGDHSNTYNQIPSLKLIVKSEKCQVNSDKTEYSIPKNGLSTPIIFDFRSCFPIEGITIDPQFSFKNYEINPDFNYLSITRKSIDGRIIFQVRNNDTGMASNTLIFRITGKNSASYLAPKPINLILVEPAPYKNPPIANNLTSSQITVSFNNVTLNMICDQPSIIYWAIGVYPSLENLTLSTIQQKLFSKDGYRSNYTEENDYKFWRIYGSEIVEAPLKKIFRGLKSDSTYQIKFICKNQMSLVSKFTEGRWNIQDNLGYLLKIILSFNQQISYEQDNDIACAIIRLLNIPHNRVYTSSSLCDEESAIQKYSGNTKFEKENITGLYQYMYYIAPDRGVDQDVTNFFIKDNLFLMNFNNSLIQNTLIPEAYPPLVDIESKDATTTLIPQIDLASVVIFPNNASIKVIQYNTNGYIYVGLREGIPDTDEAQPTFFMIKEGYYKENTPFMSFKMKYTEKNIQQLFQYSEMKKNQQYTVYIIGTRDDPTNYAETSDLIIYSYRTRGDVNLESSGLLLMFGLTNLILLIFI